jgi:hypothetical protein
VLFHYTEKQPPEKAKSPVRNRAFSHEIQVSNYLSLVSL